MVLTVLTVELPSDASRLGPADLWAEYGEMLLVGVRGVENRASSLK